MELQKLANEEVSLDIVTSMINDTIIQQHEMNSFLRLKYDSWKMHHYSDIKEMSQSYFPSNENKILSLSFRLLALSLMAFKNELPGLAQFDLVEHEDNGRIVQALEFTAHPDIFRAAAQLPMHVNDDEEIVFERAYLIERFWSLGKLRLGYGS